MKILPVLQAGSTSVLGHTYGVDDVLSSSFQRGSGRGRSSGKLQQHNGVVVVVEKNPRRASPTQEFGGGGRWRREGGGQGLA
jgi:hypothetical protein